MPQLLACPRCGRPALGGRCPDCADEFGQASTAQLVNTPADEPTRDFLPPPETQDLRPSHAPTGSHVPPDAESTAPNGPVVAGRPVQFGNYELREELGRGGMGVVFRAVQAVARREVAVKVLLGGAAGDAVYGGRFAAEVSALANLKHPNIVTVFEVGEVSGSAFFSMEYAPNGTLAGRLKDGPMPFTETAILLGKLAAATEAAHTLGVLHRDIKPGNVLIGADGEPKLSDFGLAKWVNRDESLTASGAVMGTPSYMPPEQARGEKEVGPAADVYSLGATLYECLTGRPPFRGKDAFSVIQRVLKTEPDAPRSVRRDVPPELEAICLKCLDKDPAKRYCSPQELANDLKRWQTGESTVARPLKWRQRTVRRVRRNWKPLAATALLLAVTGIVAAAWPRQGTPPDPPPVAEIEAALKRGERVELIGPSGRPKHQRWVVGTGEAGDPLPNQPFTVQCKGSGLLELTPDSHMDRFRLTAEYKQDESLSNEAGAGIYFCYKVGPGSAAGSVDRAIRIYFRDDQTTNTPLFQELGDPLEMEDVLIPRTPDKPFELHGPSLSGRMVKEAKENDSTRPWRKIVAEVTPDEVRAFWREPDGTMKLIGPATRTEEIHKNVAALHLDWLAKNCPGVVFDGLGHSPRGGVGLYLRSARVFFKNVVLEPLNP